MTECTSHWISHMKLLFTILHLFDLSWVSFALVWLFQAVGSSFFQIKWNDQFHKSGGSIILWFPFALAFLLISCTSPSLYLGHSEGTDWPSLSPYLWALSQRRLSNRRGVWISPFKRRVCDLYVDSRTQHYSVVIYLDLLNSFFFHVRHFSEMLSTMFFSPSRVISTSIVVHCNLIRNVCVMRKWVALHCGVMSTTHQAQCSMADHQRGKACTGPGQWGDVEWFQAGSWSTQTGPCLCEELDQTRDDNDWHLVSPGIPFMYY